MKAHILPLEFNTERISIKYITTKNFNQGGNLMRKKRFLSLLAAAALICSLVGCQADTEQTVQETQRTTETTEQTEQTVENVETSETETSAKKVVIAGQEFSPDETTVIIKAAKDGVDISNISLLENLQYLELLNIEEGYSYVTGFTCISEMENLEELYIKGVDIKSDFKNIQYCQNLKKLYLDLTPIDDISCIKNLTHLE